MVRHAGTLWTLRCRCGRVHERKRPVVPAALANRLEADVDALAGYVLDAWGSDTVILPVDVVNRMGAERERLRDAGDELAAAVERAIAPGRTRTHALRSLPAALRRYRTA